MYPPAIVATGMPFLLELPSFIHAYTLVAAHVLLIAASAEQHAKP